MSPLMWGGAGPGRLLPPQGKPKKGKQYLGKPAPPCNFQPDKLFSEFTRLVIQSTAEGQKRYVQMVWFLCLLWKELNHEDQWLTGPVSDSYYRISLFFPYINILNIWIAYRGIACVFYMYFNFGSVYTCNSYYLYRYFCNSVFYIPFWKKCMPYP